MDKLLEQKINEVETVEKYVDESQERLDNLKENKVMFLPTTLLAYTKESMDYLAVYNNKLIAIREELEDSYIKKEDMTNLLLLISDLLFNIEY